MHEEHQRQFLCVIVLLGNKQPVVHHRFTQLTIHLDLERELLGSLGTRDWIGGRQAAAEGHQQQQQGIARDDELSHEINLSWDKRNLDHGRRHRRQHHGNDRGGR